MLIRTSAPLKIVIAGEWAVLEPDSSAIVAAIKNRLFCEIEPNPRPEIEISLLDFNIQHITAIYENNELVFTQRLSQEELDYLKLIKFAIESTLFFYNVFKPFKIRTWCEVPERFASYSEKKIGLGSSAAVIVAILAAIHAFYGIPMTSKTEKEKLLKLALLTHFIIQNMSGSGVDIAASFYGGILQYTRFDQEWILEKIQDNSPPEVYMECNWPNLNTNLLPALPDLQLLLGWTQIPSSTSLLISQMHNFKTTNSAMYQELISQISDLVKDLSKAWKKKDKKRVLADIKINEMYLSKLSEFSGIPIEIDQLKLLCHIADELGGAGKLSGTGGGDCGIALCFKEEIAQKILQEWEKYAILGSKVEIDYEGLRIEFIKQ